MPLSSYAFEMVDAQVTRTNGLGGGRSVKSVPFQQSSIRTVHTKSALKSLMIHSDIVSMMASQREVAK